MLGQIHGQLAKYSEAHSVQHNEQSRLEYGGWRHHVTQAGEHHAVVVLGDGEHVTAGTEARVHRWRHVDATVGVLTVKKLASGGGIFDETEYTIKAAIKGVDALWPGCARLYENPQGGPALLRVMGSDLPVEHGPLDRYIKPESRNKLGDTAWFCNFPRCDVAYFNLFEAVVLRDELSATVYPFEIGRAHV